MHEMSIAEGILDVALDTLRQHDASVIHSVQLDLGLMSGVEPDSLLFCWEAVTKGTAAEGSHIEINTIPIEGKCLDWWPRTTSDLHGYRLIERLGHASSS